MWSCVNEINENQYRDQEYSVYVLVTIDIQTLLTLVWSTKPVIVVVSLLDLFMITRSTSQKDKMSKSDETEFDVKTSI